MTSDSRGLGFDYLYNDADRLATLQENAATVAGNVAYGSPAADMMPPLLSLDAEVTLTSARGSRGLPLDGLFTGFKASVRAADELIPEIAWPAPAANSVNLFYKLGLRKGDAISIVCLAVTVAAEAGACSRVRIALGAVAPTVIRANAAEDMLVGQVLRSPHRHSRLEIT